MNASTGGPGLPREYSGTSLAKKLGIRAGSVVVTREAPREYLGWLEPLPDGVTFAPQLSRATTVYHLFVDREADLAAALAEARQLLDPAATVWVSWPKKTAKVPTDITEGTIREVALPLGFVDVKVCAVSDVWSGLKLVVRKELR